MSILCLCLTAFIPIYYFKYRSKPKILTDGRFRTLFDGIKIWKALCGLYFMFFCIRRLAIIVLFMFYKVLSVRVKMIIFIVLQVPQLLYLLIFRPLSSVKDQILEILCEFILLLFSLTVTLWQTEEQWTRARLDGLLYTMMAIGFFVQIVQIVESLITACIFFYNLIWHILMILLIKRSRMDSSTKLPPKKTLVYWDIDNLNKKINTKKIKRNQIIDETGGNLTERGLTTTQIFIPN